MLGAARAYARQAFRARGVHTSPTLKAGGEHVNYRYDYLHGPKMYDIPGWPNRKAKVTAWIIGIITVGASLPLVAAEWQFRKAKGGA